VNYLCYIILFGCTCFIGCKKLTRQDYPTEVRGTKFDLLLKTVDKYVDGESVTTYTYDGNKQLIQENSVRDFVDGTKWTVTSNWYRKPGGQLDSMKSEYTYGSEPAGLQKQYYHYDASGTLTYSILFRNKNNPFSSIDSSVYIYAGPSVIKRMDYTSAMSTILNNTLTHEIFYQYDASNNISAIVFVNYDFSAGAPPRKDTVTLTYSYDKKKNPYYENEAFYAYFANLGFENYASQNNIVQIMYSGRSSSNYKDEFSFQYNIANKPDKVLESSYGVGITQPIIRTADYYYD
jgi:hypothetical protein